MTPEKKIQLYQISCSVLLALLLVLFFWFPRTSQEIKSEIAPDTTTQAIVEDKASDMVREIIPGGYVINNSLFYSPELDLAFTGRLGFLKFKNGLFYEDRSYDGRSGDDVTEEDILFWDYIKVFPKVSTELTPEEVLTDLLIAEGKDPANCLINHYPSAEAENLDQTWKEFSEPYYISNKDTYNIKYPYPDENFYNLITQEEVFEEIKPISRWWGKNIDITTFSEYKAFCDSDVSPECMWDYDIALDIIDAEACSGYATKGSFLFSDGDFSTYHSGISLEKKAEMPYYFVRGINTRDISPWLGNTVTDITPSLLHSK